MACRICNCPLEGNGHTEAMDCNHVFHRACLDDWMKTHDSCPVCTGNDCCICMTSIGDQPQKQLACDHVFHVGCINTWLRTHQRCPVCRNKSRRNESDGDDDDDDDDDRDIVVSFGSDGDSDTNSDSDTNYKRNYGRMGGSYIRTPAIDYRTNIDGVRERGTKCAECHAVWHALCYMKCCSGCRSVYYCGGDCQQAHWASHRLECAHLSK